MNATIANSVVAGSTRAPPSKSYSHRALLAGGYADSSVIERPLLSADTRATIRAIRAFGGHVSEQDDTVRITGFDGQPAVPDDVIDCANSGTTMRLVTATASLVDGMTVLTGDASLRSRPHGPLLDAIGTLGGRAESTRGNGQAPLVVNGPIRGGTVSIPGDVSSQFVTALLMAGAVTGDGIEVTLTTALKSAPYVEVTRDLLADFGIETGKLDHGYVVPGDQVYEPTEGTYTVPGDFSSVSYLLAAGVLAGDDGVTIEGAKQSAQGDTAIIDIVQEMGGEVTWNKSEGVLTATRSDLQGTTIDVGNTPDLLPTIAVLGAAASGTTRITNAEHVRYKETDRVTAMAEELSTMGASVEEETDSLLIHGEKSQLTGTTVDGRGDHRVIMSLAIAGLIAEGETTITGAEHIDVSYPDFFEVLAALGAEVRAEVREDG